MKKLNKKILFYPKFGENQYTENIFNAVKSFSEDIDQVEPINFGILKNGINAYDIAIVHWLDNTLVNANKSVSIMSILKYLTKFIILKIVSKKIVYVRHNIYPHALTGRSAKIAQHLIEFVIKLCDKCVVHSGHLETNDTVYIPHPLYNIQNQESLTVNQDLEDFFVIFGRILEYKAIDKLLNSWGSESLIVAGKVDSDVYLESLNQIVRNRNLNKVSIVAKFLSDAEAAKLVASSNGLIITHNDDDMIVSGSFFFAVSLGTPVYAVKSLFFEWLIKHHNYPGLFIYSDFSALVRGISENKQIDRSLLLKASQSLFGDSTVKKAWEKFFIELGREKL